MTRNIKIQGRFPFNQNFRFEFPATSSSEWNSSVDCTEMENEKHRSFPSFTRKFQMADSLPLLFALETFNDFELIIDELLDEDNNVVFFQCHLAASRDEV